MAGPSKKTVEQKLQVVLSMLRSRTSEQSVHNWKRLFLESGRNGLAQGQRRRSSRAAEVEAENEELKAALCEVHV